MSNPKEIDNRVARTEVANFIHHTAPPYPKHAQKAAYQTWKRALTDARRSIIMACLFWRKP
jgi:hypothetical protein